MKKKILNIGYLALFSFCLILNTNETNKKIDITYNQINKDKLNLTVGIKLEPDEIIYANSLNLSIDHPDFEILNWNTNIQPAKTYDSSFKEINAYNKNFDIALQIKRNTNSSKRKVNLHLSYLTNKNKYNVQEIIPLNFNTESQKTSVKDIEITKSENKNVDNITISTKKEEEEKSLWSYLQKFSKYTQNLIKNNNSIWIRIFLVFVLGILMSLTPCIYPIIPITVGILQTQASKSLLYNFLLSLSYSVGIATTFALFGLTAALTGHLFGQILTQPIFVIFICAVLIYFALSMLGFYDMYVPKFLQNKENIEHKGSIFSAFIFGAISGSVASPCLSPGLALLLTIVATLANKFLGFILLFSFGIGLSVPLLIIGTFSSSINLLPQAGSWMVEVKKIFGFMLFAMVFYYLKNILPYSILLLFISIFILASGIYYLKSITPYDSKFWKITKNILGIGLIGLSTLLFVKTFQEIFFPTPESEKDVIWTAHYDNAVQQAKKTNKKLLIDIGATYCTLCKAIDKYVFNDEKVKNLLNEFVPVKVDATDTNSEPYVSLKEKYEIIGVPTVLIINASTGELYKKWQGELYDIPKLQVIDELKEILFK